MESLLSMFKDGTIVFYVWIAQGITILIASIFLIRWAVKNGQFDEDIKYQIFDGNDDERFLKNEK